ncbi:MAG: hypothetical protein ABEJ65_03880, partial [bacterium]
MNLSGGGGGGPATELFPYLLEQRDRPRKPRVLRGDPHRTFSLIKDLHESGRSQTYTHFSLSFMETFTDEQLKSYIDEFEEVAFAGLQESQYEIVWVVHEEEGDGIHLHAVAVRQELLSGNDLNIMPPNWEASTLGLWESYINTRDRLADPGDPVRQDLTHTTNNDWMEDWKIKQDDPRPRIDERVERAIHEGLVLDRSDLLELIQKLVPDYDIETYDTFISLISDEQSWRLQGPIYRKDWTREQQR